MEEIIMKILTGELSYTEKEARITCHDLLAIQDGEIRQALMLWMLTREMTPVSAEGFDAVTLTEQMYYPSALLAIDLLRKDPAPVKGMLMGGFL